MKFILSIALILLGWLSIQAQPTSIALQIDTLVTTSDTVELQARQTNIIFDVGAVSPTLTISAPGADYRGFRVTITQLNADGGEALILDSLGSGSEFQATNTPSSDYTFSTATYIGKTFICLQVATDTWKWVLIN